MTVRANASAGESPLPLAAGAGDTRADLCRGALPARPEDDVACDPVARCDDE
jgi:hypothetical protein